MEIMIFCPRCKQLIMICIGKWHNKNKYQCNKCGLELVILRLN